MPEIALPLSSAFAESCSVRGRRSVTAHGHRLQGHSICILWVQSCGVSCMQAVMTFDLGCPVGDAAWAPYSATVFAAADDEGRVQVGLRHYTSQVPGPKVPSLQEVTVCRHLTGHAARRSTGSYCLVGLMCMWPVSTMGGPSWRRSIMMIPALFSRRVPEI